MNTPAPSPAVHYVSIIGAGAPEARQIREAFERISAVSSQIDGLPDGEMLLRIVGDEDHQVLREALEGGVEGVTWTMYGDPGDSSRHDRPYELADLEARMLRARFHLHAGHTTIPGAAPGTQSEPAYEPARLRHEIRAVKELKELQERDPLLAGLRWHVHLNRWKGIMAHDLVDERGAVLGFASERAPAIAMARRNRLRMTPPWQMTFEQFRQVSVVVPVVAGRGKTGEAKTGPARLLIDGSTSEMQPLLNELNEAFQLHFPDGTAEERKLWVSTSRDTLLMNDFPGDVKVYSPTGLSTLILAKPSAPRENLQRDAHLLAVCDAIEQGLPVPEAVLQETAAARQAMLAEDAGQAQRERAAERMCG